MEIILVKDLETYIEEYMEEKQEIKDITEETVKKQTFNLRKFIEFLELSKITDLNESNVKKVLKQYRRYCLKVRGNKRDTVKTYMMNIIEFLNYDEVRDETKHRKVKIKEIIDVKRENSETARKRIEKISLTQNEAKIYLDTILKHGNIRDYSIVRTFLDTGLRLKELVLLNKSDIKAPLDYNGFFILPEDKSDFVEVHVRAEISKGEYKHRTTFITPVTLHFLNEMIFERIVRWRWNDDKELYYPNVQRKKLEKEKKREELFINQNGVRFKRRGVQDIVKKYTYLTDERVLSESIPCRVNYARDVSPHVLRHSALTHYAEVLTISEVQSIAGHSSSETTDKYIHVDHAHIKGKLKLGCEAFLI